MNAFFLLVSVILVLAVIGYYYGQHEGGVRESSNQPERQQEPNSDLPEWPVAYQTYVHSELHSLKIELESDGIRTIVEEVAPGTWGEGVAIQHTLRVHPDDAKEAFDVIDEFVGDEGTDDTG
jgi:hypothetical protein